MSREVRNLAIDTASIEIEERDGGIAQIRGYAAVFYDGTPGTEFKMGNIRERIMPGAFRKAIDRGDDVRALFNHDPNMILGRRSAKTLKLFEDSKGLRYIIDTPNTTVGRDVAEYLRRGDVGGSSFGFQAEEEEWRDDEGGHIRELRSLGLFDVGPVTYPAYTGTEASLRSLDEAYREWRAKNEKQSIDFRLRELDLEEIA